MVNGQFVYAHGPVKFEYDNRASNKSSRGSSSSNSNSRNRSESRSEIRSKSKSKSKSNGESKGKEVGRNKSKGGGSLLEEQQRLQLEAEMVHLKLSILQETQRLKECMK